MYQILKITVIFAALLNQAEAGTTAMGRPLWTFTPLTDTVIDVLPSETKTIQYTITNQSRKTHVLAMQSIRGITHNTSSGCPNPFSLAYHQSCTLTLDVDGSSLPGNIVGGPNVCDMGNSLQCYQPGWPNNIQINLLPEPPAPTYSSFLVGGFYSSDGNNYLPLLVRSIDGGVNWDFVDAATNLTGANPAIDMTNTLDRTFYYKATCAGNLCLAPGSYYSTDTVKRPVLGVSHDGGVSWGFPSSITIPNMGSAAAFSTWGALQEVSFLGRRSIAVGYYRDSNSNYKPLLALSTDSGNTWTYSQELSLMDNIPDGPHNSGALLSSASSDNFFVVAGQYAQTPYVEVSNNGGVSWTFPTDINTGLPSDFSDGVLKKVSCSGPNCIAAGSYSDGYGNVFPLLAITTNSGVNWNYPAAVINPVVVPATAHFDWLNGASCRGNTCIAVGQYKDVGTIQRPLLAITKDAGSTWSFPASITNPVLIPALFQLGVFYDISCSASICMAVGEYNYSPVGRRALAAISTDGGDTWTYSSEISGPALTPVFNATTSLRGVSCVENTCVAGGNYMDGLLEIPLIVVTLDAGATWSVPSSVTTPVLNPAFNSMGYLYEGFVSGF